MQASLTSAKATIDISAMTNRQKYAIMRAKRKAKSRIKYKVIFTMAAAASLIALIIYVLPPILPTADSPSFSTHAHSHTSSFRSLLATNESSSEEEDYPEGYPPDLLTAEQRKNGGWILYFLGMCYTFFGIALVCDEWFVPAIEEVVESLDMTPDAAGATFMAAGGSAPELFTSLIGTFIARSNVGFGTIVGSAVFNVLFVIGCCAIFTPGHLPLTWWPFARDCLYYIISLVTLAIFYGVISEDEIEWWESMILLLMYVGYVVLMFNNRRLHDWVFAKLGRDNPSADEKETVMNSEQSKEALEMTEAADNGTKSGNKSPQDGASPGGNGGGRPVFFHASFYNFLTKDSTFLEAMGVHIVARMKGSTRETFNLIDTDGNGHIDRDELKRVLQSLGEHVSDEDVTLCFNEVDTDGNGEISYVEFESWYLASKLRLTSDIRDIFRRFDDNHDLHIDATELRKLLSVMNEQTERKGVVSDEEIATAMRELGKAADGRISEDEFIEWYAGTEYFNEKQMQRVATLKTVEEREEEEDGIDFAFPSKTLPRVMWVVTWPIMFSMYYTLPDVQKARRKHLWPLTFAGSMLWLMFYSYLMVWWAIRIGEAWGVPDEVMGLTFLAAGTSVPDLLSSVIVAKLGEGDMAVSSSIGSNIFDILIGLPLPWLLFAVTIGSDTLSIAVVSNSLFLSVVILIVMLFLVLCVVRLNGWRLTHKLGWSMFVLWILFVTQDLVRQLCTSCNP